MGSFAFAGIPIALRFSGSFRAADAVLSRYAPFRGEARGPKVLLDIRPKAWRGGAPSGARLRLKGGLLRAERGDFSAALDMASGKGRAAVAENPYSVDSLLRVLLSWLLPRRGGLVVHAASLVRGGLGYLFPGVSGSGKSTLVRSAGPDALALTDELSLARLDGPEARVHASPFWGELKAAGAQGRYPLEGVLFIRKGPAARKRPLSRAEAVRRLLPTAMCFERDAAGAQLALDRARDLAEAVPCWELEFAKGGPFWDAVAGRRA